MGSLMDVACQCNHQAQDRVVAAVLETCGSDATGSRKVEGKQRILKMNQ